MTVEEKREALQRYCNENIFYCSKCKLHKKYGDLCHGEFISPCYSDNKIKADYEMVFGNECTPNDPTPVLSLPNITNTTDNINSPSHYTYGKIECIDFIQDKQLNFCLGNAIKYIVRAGHKHSDSLTDKEKAIEDLKKAKKYLEFEIEERNKANES